MSSQHDESTTWIPWDASYELGIPAVDAQHKHLVALVNRFRSELMEYSSKEGTGWQNALATVLRETVQYTKTHFSAEEKLMQASGYPNFEYHKRCHQEFVETVTYILESFQTVTLQAAFEFVSYLKEWILSHIAYEDRQYQQCLVEYSRRMYFSG